MQKLLKYKKNSDGFTLIELLIVIIIIGILAAIAIVAYTGTQNKAKQSAAQATLEEVRNKLAEFNADYGSYPTAQGTSTDGTCATAGATCSLNAWMASSDGGNNTTLATTFVGPEYSYAATPAGCDNSTTDCTGYTVSAAAAEDGGTTITETQ